MTKAVQSLNHVVLMGIRPEQDFTGYVVQESNDLLEGESVMNWHIGDVRDLRLSWFQPGGIAAIAARFPKTLGDVKSVIYRHTCYPLFKAFMAPDKADALYQFHVNGSSASTWTYRYRHERPLPARLAICPDCFNEDVENFGYPIRRRLHLVGGILACHVHKRTLLASCGMCIKNPGHNKAHWDVQAQCGCSRNLKEIEKLSNQELSVAVSVASMAQQILDGFDMRAITSKKIMQAIRLKALESSVEPYQFFHESLQRCLGSKGLTRLKFTRTLIHGFTSPSGRRPQNPIHNLTAIFSAFGSLEELIHYIMILEKEEVVVIEEERASIGNSNQTLSVSDIERLTTKYREWLEKQLDTHPDILRSELRRLPKGGLAVAHLRKYDREHFYKRVPKGNGATRLKLNARRRRERLYVMSVTALVDHINARYRHVISARPTDRIFKRYLLEGAQINAISRIRNAPEVKLALERCSDDYTKWRMHKVEDLCSRVRLVSKTSPYGVPANFLHLDNQHSFYAKVHKVEKWLKQEIAKLSVPL